MGNSTDRENDRSIFGYRWTEAEKNMISFDLSIPAPIDRRKQPYQNLRSSTLELLPLEILHHIFEYLDPGSLAALRSLNFSMSEVVWSLPAFRDMVQCAPHVLKALSRTRLIRRYDILRLYRTLKCLRCEYCEAYGPYLYLLQCSRCCYFCLRWNDRLISIPLKKGKRILRSSNVKSRSLPMLFTVIGTYTIERKFWKKQFWLVSWDDVCAILRNSQTELETSQSGETFIQFSRQNIGSDRDRFHCHAAIAFPSLSYTGDKIVIQHGIWCRGCEDTWYFANRHASHDELRRIYDAQEVAYSHTEFTEHCKECPGVKRLSTMKYPNFDFEPEHRNCIQRN